MLPPRFRAGLLRFLATFPGGTAEEVTIDGKRYWAVGFPHRGQTKAELYVDPTTGRIVGQGEIELARMADPSACAAAGRSRHTTGAPPPGCAYIPIPPAQQRRVPTAFWSTRLGAY